MRFAGVFLIALFALSAWGQDASWKPVVVLFRTAECAKCDDFERVTLPHPAIARRLPAVAFAVRQVDSQWGSTEPGIALFDAAGVLRVRWPIVPDTTDFGILLDSVIAVAPHFARGGDVEIAIALARLGRSTDARALLERVREHGSPEMQQQAATALAALDAPRERPPATPAATVVRILPLGVQIVTGRQTVRTHVSSTAVARVVFSMDGQEAQRVDQPPFSMVYDFGTDPGRRTIGVVAFDDRGRELGRDVRVVNDAGETFWLRFVEPRVGPVRRAVRVAMDVRVPPQREIRRVVVSWNDVERAVLTAAPWETVVRIPFAQIGILRAVAELDDGRTSEDAVLLNARGAFDQSNVQLVQLPITILPRDGSVPRITARQITVRESGRVRPVESIATAAETPLTIGLLFDTSDSMQKTLPDLQEAAIRFLETMLADQSRDRAFLIRFDSYARLLQPATSDVARLRSRIMSLRPDGATSLYDAIVLGLLQFEGTKGRRALIVFSDGVDRTSRYTAEEVAELARRVNIPIHVISAMHWMPESNARRRWLAEEGDAQLKRLGPATGGTAHTLTALTELPAVYARIDAALRAQILAFIRTDAPAREREWRRVEVHVTGTEADVYAPEGYYASW